MFLAGQGMTVSFQILERRCWCLGNDQLQMKDEPLMCLVGMNLFWGFPNKVETSSWIVDRGHSISDSVPSASKAKATCDSCTRILVSSTKVGVGIGNILKIGYSRKKKQSAICLCSSFLGSRERVGSGPSFPKLSTP